MGAKKAFFPGEELRAGTFAQNAEGEVNAS